MNTLATLVLRSPIHALEGTGLHDATLLEVSLDWRMSQAKLEVLLLGGIPATLAFQGVTSSLFPKAQPWGPSNSINEAKVLSTGEYAVEMQSGDVLLFKAASWSLSITVAPGEA
jgi:hypothetical protein